MADRRLLVVMALATPLLVLAILQGMLTAGLLPLAIFGPVYALARATTNEPGRARVAGTQVTVAASLGAGLALAPALLMIARDTSLATEAVGAGLLLLGAGIGALAGVAAAPEPRRLTADEARRWTLVEALDDDHARGLRRLFLVALPLGLLVGLLREAPILAGDGVGRTITGALFGDALRGGAFVFPDATAEVVVAVPLTLAPLAIGFLASVRRVLPLTVGGIAALALAPLIVALDVPVALSGSGLVPITALAEPGLAIPSVLAPAAAGLLVGAGVLYVGRTTLSKEVHGRSLWAALGALVALLTHGVVPAIGLLLGTCVAAAAVVWRTGRAPLGVALASGLLVGLAVDVFAPGADAALTGGLVGVVAGAAVVTAATTRTLPLPEEAVRSNRTLGYLLVAGLVAGIVTWVGAEAIVDGTVPFPAPHARALATGVSALVTGQGSALLVWGLGAGLLLQYVWGRGALVAIGVLVGPAIGMLVLLGSLARVWWESRLFERARQGFVMRGEMGYELVRAHVIVAAVLAGEALAVALGPLFA